MDPTATLANVRSWPIQGRLNLLFDLWNELASEGLRPEPSDELDAELDRRLVAHEKNPTDVRTWDQILDRIRRRS